MTYRHSELYFYDDKINFYINDIEVLIGCKSLIKSIGANWPTQYKKINSREDLRCHVGTIKTNTYGGKILCFERSGVNPILNSINESKISEYTKHKLSIYKKEFLQFTFDSIECEQQIEKEDYYLSSKAGIKQLIWDSTIGLGNPNAIDQIATILDSIVNNDIFPSKIPFVDKEYCPKTRKAVSDMISELRLKYAEISSPAYDLAEKTAYRGKELAKYKTESLGAQIEAISEQIYDTDRKASLQLKRLAKGLFK